MLERARTWLIGLSLVIVFAGLGYVFFGGGETPGGNAGLLEPTNFQTLTHGPDSEITGFLLCASSLCEKSIIDGPAPTYTTSPSKVMAAIGEYADTIPFIRTHTVDLGQFQLEFLERLPSEISPSVVVVRLTQTSLGQTVVNLYSYKPLGDSERSDHEDRVQRWVKALDDRLPS